MASPRSSTRCIVCSAALGFGALVLNAEVATMLIDRGRADELPAVLRQIQTDARRCAAKVRNMTDVAAPASAARTSFPLAETLSAVRQRMCRRLNRLLNTIALDVSPQLAPVHGNRDAIEYALYQLARQVYASGVDHPRISVAPHGDRTCVSIGASAPPPWASASPAKAWPWSTAAAMSD